MYFTRKIKCIGAAYGISRNVSSKLSRSTNHPLHGHNFSNSDLYTFALQAKGSPPLLACFPKADFEPTRSEASFIPSLCEARLPSGPQFVSTARSIERAFLLPRSARETTLGFREQPWPAFARKVRRHATPRLALSPSRAHPSPSAPPPRHPAHALSPFPFGFHTARNLPPQEPIMDGT